MTNTEDFIKIGFIKRAQELQVPEELVTILVKRADDGILSQLANSVRDFTSSIDTGNPADAWKTSLLGSLGGAGVGGLYNAFGNIGKKEEDKSSILGGALKGGLLGGVAGHAMPHLKEMFKQPPQPAPTVVNNVSTPAPAPTPPPAAPAPAPQNITLNAQPEPELRPELSELKAVGLAPYKTRGALANTLLSTLPGGAAISAMSVDPDARSAGHVFSNFNNFATIPALGTAAGAMLPKGYKLPGALIGNFAGNMLGNHRYNADQANAFSNLAQTFTPEALLENKNISSAMRSQLAEALAGEDPSRIRDAVSSLSAYTPEQQIPTQFKMVQDAVNDQNLPGWYEDPSMLQRIRNFFKKD